MLATIFRAIVGLFFVASAVGAIFGAVQLWDTVRMAESAPQQAAGAALAAALAIIPYVFARSLQAWMPDSNRQ